VVEFGGEHFRQTRGTAMGTQVAVVYSILVLCSMEEDITSEMPFTLDLLTTSFHCALGDKQTPSLMLLIVSILTFSWMRSLLLDEREGFFLDINLFIKENGTI
jgi:hypothetical protein